MYFPISRRLDEDKTDHVRSPPSVHLAERFEAERASRAFTSASCPNDSHRLRDPDTAADQRQPYHYAITSPPSSSSFSPVSKAAAVHPTPAEVASQEQSILEYYAQTMPLSAACQSVQKRCAVEGCCKISVSRGLCRGHGGGRRCHFEGGCTKSAQSRSMFCWAHGGGQRCDVPECMRSRKSKRFCVAHLYLEAASSHSPDHKVSSQPRRGRAKKAPSRAPRTVDSEQWERLARLRGNVSEPRRRRLPSLRQALTDASRTLPNLPLRPPPRAFCA